MEDVLLERICTLPAEFKAGTKSVAQLFREWGLSTGSELPDTRSVASYIGRHPNLVDSWLNWSADKRTSSGWYFLYENGAYTVGFHPRSQILKFAQPEVACAEFILREIKHTIGVLN